MINNEPKPETRTFNDWTPETRSLLKSIIATGCTLVSGDNGEYKFKFVVGEMDKFIENLIACDESHLYLKSPDGKNQWVYLVLGNEPGVMASDYSVCPELNKATEEHYAKWENRKQPVRHVVLVNGKWVDAK